MTRLKELLLLLSVLASFSCKEIKDDRFSSASAITVSRSENEESTRNMHTTSSGDLPEPKNKTGIKLNDEETEIDDMILDKKQMDALYSKNSMKRTGLKNAFHHWPMAIVPYEIDPAYGPMTIVAIREAMEHIMNVSCVRFVPRNQHYKDYILIQNGPGCSSEVGLRNMGMQPVKINDTLCEKGKIVHELLHSLGFLHMHTANERDKFIQIQWSNVREEAKVNFNQFLSHVTMFGTSYDFNSILHYSPYAFAKDKNSPTIVPLAKAGNMGQREAMSEGDILRLNRMYNCPSFYTQKRQRNVAIIIVKYPGMK